MAAGPISRILSAVTGRTIIPLGHALLRGSSDLPGGCGAPSRHAFPAKPKLHREIPPYLVLLRVGFALPAALLPRRCALTAPFHPYLAVVLDPPILSGFTTTARRYIFCGTFRRTVPPMPARGPSRTLSGTLLCGVRTFLCLSTAIVRSGCQLFDYSARQLTGATDARPSPPGLISLSQAAACSRGASVNAYTSNATPISNGISPTR